MKPELIKGLLFTSALLLALPAIQIANLEEAEARPGSILRESRQSSERSHNVQRRNESRSQDRSEERSSRRSDSSSTSRRNYRPSPSPRPTGRTRPVQQDRHYRSSSHHYHHRSHHHHHYPSPYHRSHTRVHTSTTVHHHHHDHRHQQRRHSYQPPAAAPKAPPSRKTYLTFGLGMSGFASPTITDTALPGTEFNLGVGVLGSLFGFELGFHGSGYTFDPGQAGVDLAFLGASGDFKIQPELAFLRPFFSLGAGAYHFQDAILRETALGGAFRLGLGLDFHFDSVAISARYLRSFYGIVNQRSYYDGAGIETESLGLNLAIFF